MNQNLAIGSRVKQLRTKKRLTLKQLSDLTGLSTGFLSQLERGISTIAIDSLSKVAASLDVELTSFFNPVIQATGEPVTRSFEQQFVKVSPRVAECVLSKDTLGFQHLPRLIQIMPSASIAEPPTEMYSHQGEEILYVLEGILTVYINGSEYVLYPGDTLQLNSEDPHNWANRTSRNVRFLQINYPNPYLYKNEQTPL